jgi:lipopolysaccharide transport system ATP-binding protein
MTSEALIQVKGVGKRYILHRILPSATPGHGSRPATTSPVDRQDPKADEVWALRGITFEVPRGHVLGVIGRNGSGKSTLLSILARVTAPTEGSVTLRGRVAALLQVGTGFHPEFTGRENVYLSATILGMSRAQTDAAFESIVDFSGIGSFLDAPVKHYSSGMAARLAFSVSVHLQSDVLLVDEVLAVGDEAFTNRASERIRSVIKDGRSVIVVSHNMPSIRALCDSAMLLERGSVVYTGAVSEAIEHYANLWRQDGAVDASLRVPSTSG